MTTLRVALKKAVDVLRPVFDEDAQNDAEILLAHATKRNRSTLSLNLDETITGTEETTFEASVKARANYQPIAQIIGIRDFWNHSFIVTPDVLDPRPDTETLVEAALKHGPKQRVLDLGTGSGCILLSLLAEWPTAKGLGIDVSNAALNVARANAEHIGLADRVSLIKGDWCAGLQGPFDMIVSNPPYISGDEMNGLDRDVIDWEPRFALTPEGDGLDSYRILAAQVPSILAKAAPLLLEIGENQAESVCSIFKSSGFHTATIIQDINQKDRVIELLV